VRWVRFARAAAFLLVFAAPLGLSARALAQSADSSISQMQLTEAQVQAYVAAQRDLKGVIFRLPEVRADLPDVKSPAQVESILNRHGFKNLDEYNGIANNITLVLEGVDPATKSYIGAAALLRRQLDDIESDSSISPRDRAIASAELKAAMRVVAPVRYPSNIDLVVRNLDAILANSPFAATTSND